MRLFEARTYGNAKVVLKEFLPKALKLAYREIEVGGKCAHPIFSLKMRPVAGGWVLLGKDPRLLDPRSISTGNLYLLSIPSILPGALPVPRLRLDGLITTRMTDADTSRCLYGANLALDPNGHG